MRNWLKPITSAVVAVAAVVVAADCNGLAVAAVAHKPELLRLPMFDLMTSFVSLKQGL
ncbi:MAG: hypothetical protein NTW35_02470 [Candidatus Nomurabacteria bacterium]|nr:hypothetical protein [Candidatus Nomurabacteria bacterium]